METVKQLQEEAAGRAEALGLELQKATKQLEDANKQVRDRLVSSLPKRCRQMQNTAYSALLLLGKEVLRSEWRALLRKWNQRRK